MIEDLLTPDTGLAIAERPVEHSELGASPSHLKDMVLGVLRDNELHPIDDGTIDALEDGDRLLYVRKGHGEQ